jgi:hypothetical protein
MRVLPGAACHNRLILAGMNARERHDWLGLPKNSWPAGRSATVVAVVVAVAAAALTGYLLVDICHGYLQAIHHQLPPNPTFGFRDATTRAGLPAWYAAQRAGFSWLLFGGGPLLVLNLAFCVFAAVNRRPPWEVFAVSLLVAVLLFVVVMAAGVHADHVARTLTG